MKFYLGVHAPAWLKKTDVPLFISYNRLKGYKKAPKALGPWAMDSGGFTEISTKGKWTVGADEYVEAAEKIAAEAGNLDWAAPQDWMCEPWIITKTGKTIAEHQELTVANFLDLRARSHNVHFVPVLQGWEIDDYLRCYDLYEQAGVDLQAEPTVGLGSVCRRQSSDDIANVVKTLYSKGLRLHGFGVKTGGLGKYQDYLYSADSMAWSFAARYGQIRLEGCKHVRCQNCLKYALQWRSTILGESAGKGGND